MSFNYNQVTLVGRLTKEPEMRQVTDTFSVLNFTVAVGKNYKKGEGFKDTDFIPVSLTGNPAENGEKLLKKGTPILVWGKLSVRSYEKEEERKWITEVKGDNFQLLAKKLENSESAIEEMVEEVA